MPEQEDSPLWWPITRLREAFRRGELSPVEVLEEALARIARFNPSLNAYLDCLGEQAREQAKTALADYERELARAREESSQMINDARAQAKQLADELRAKNEKELAERMARATADIEAAKSAAVSDLHAQAATLATMIAGKILKREITPADEKQLVDESLAELGSRN